MSPEEAKQQEFNILKTSIESGHDLSSPSEAASTQLELPQESTVSEEHDTSEFSDEQEADFKRILDKFYIEVDEAAVRLQEDQQEFDDKLSNSGNPFSYFYDYSSSYYQQSQTKFDK
mmetsp:Transcript_4584/g.6957  ORF Transcript_4584/g.6957 Transcript_4584/m.6957 type:complete len:117 (+) Transcript_4584:510-860(+)